MTQRRPAPRPPAVGAVYRIPDALTGWSRDRDKLRWAVVVAVNMPISARLLPRSASIEEGVHVGIDALDCFSKDGHFFFDPKSIPLVDLRHMEYGGMLEPAHRNLVLNFYYDELDKRKPSRRRPSGRRA
jgi:hypothetical protein